MRMHMIALLMAGTLVAAAGCQSTAPPRTKPEPVSAAAYPQIVAQGGLNKFLANDKPRISRADSGAMTVSVPVRVLRNRDVSAQYRFIFFGDDDRPLHPQMDWQYQTLPARTQVFLDGTSLDPDATDWRLEIRPAR